MPVHIYLAPAAGGKTAWVLASVRRAAANLRRIPLVVVATPLQAQSLRARLAAAGGAMGVQIVTFDGLYAAVLQQVQVVYTELDEPVRYRLLRAVLDDLAARGVLHFYHNLVARPGFIAAIEGLLGELKGAGVRPSQLAAAIAALGAPVRLAELSAIYAGYQSLLDANGWTDRPGVAWLALAALRKPARTPLSWGPLYFDGFDSFTVVQRAVISALATQVDELGVLLTGTPTAAEQSPYLLFGETAALLSCELAVPLMSLPAPASIAQPNHALRPLAERLFVPHVDDAAIGAPVTMMAAADRAGEARAALRWLKQRVVLDKMRPHELLLLARNVPAYRDLVAQIAAEFGMRVHSSGHLPLAANPAVANLLELLHLMLPDPHDGQPLLPRRRVVEAWRSPYFDWSADDDSPGIAAGDADALDVLARRFLVLRGLAQWREAFALATAAAERAPAAEGAPAAVEYALAERFARFVACLTPPPAARLLRDFVCWLEDLIGVDPFLSPNAAAGEATADAGFTLAMVARIRAGAPALQERDVAALRCFKDVLRGLVQAEQAISSARGEIVAAAGIDYGRFLAELDGAVAVARYEPVHNRSGSILLADLNEARGVSYRAAAMLGLGEGELPHRRSEDPFLRDSDRQLLRSRGAPLEDSTRTFDREWFYLSIGRAREQLLLCRPRLAENGAPWEPSSYWQAVERLAGVQPLVVRGEQRLDLREAASLPELVAGAHHHPAAAAWLLLHAPATVSAVRQGAACVAACADRRAREERSILDNFLGDDRSSLAALQPSLQQWSPSRLERYRACPYWFYLSHVLHLEQRDEPEEGANFAQTGNLYHRIFEQLYRSVSDTTDLAQLLANLPAVAKSVLDAAPQEEGFRVTAWWGQVRSEIEANIAASLQALAAYDGAPCAFEQYFGRERPLTITVADLTFTVSGVIDRIDRRPDGSLRIIDYKTGVSDYSNEKALVEGRRLQLALYALAAQDALAMGTVSDGFYWFVHKACSGWSMAEFQDPATAAAGPAAAIALARIHAVDAVSRARRGEFAPQPPALGCPDYCTAAAFCWRYRPKYMG